MIKIDYRKDFLIIEPNAGSRELFVQFFRLNNIEASNNIVKTFKEALVLLDEDKIKYKCCIISIDFNPEFNGYEGICYLTKYHPGMVVIASGIVPEKTYTKLKDYRTDGFFQKYFASDKTEYNKIFFLKYIKNYHAENRLQLKYFVDATKDDYVNIVQTLDFYRIKHKIEIIDINARKDLVEFYKIQAIPSIIREQPQPYLHFLGELKNEKEVLALIS